MREDPGRAERLLARLERFGMRLGLETVQRVLEEMGDPHRRLTTVLVAGTNGKGSVAAMIAAMGTAAGHRTGLFTSPHLETVSERMRIDDRRIPADRLGELLEEVDACAVRTTGASATYFESLFLAACVWFLEENTDLVVLEVGLGGRLDATNACDPVLSVVTEIAIEHRAQLGDTIEQIAREKAGILRPSRPAVIGVEDVLARESLRASAREIGARWIDVGGRIEIVDAHENPDWSRRVCLRSESAVYDLHLQVPGRHQDRNLATAVAAVETLRDDGWTGFDAAAVARGISACVWPGRLERIDLPGRSGVVLDAAHNPQAARVLADFVQERLTGYTLVFGVLDDKDVGEMLPAVSSLAQRVVLTRPGSTRGRPPSDISALSRCSDTVVVESPRKALDRALATGAPVLVCGSIYLVGEARGQLRERFGVPPRY